MRPPITVPRPRKPQQPDVRRWYETELGWPVRGDPPELVTGVCFDALRVPADAGLPLLARSGSTCAVATGPVLRAGGQMWLLIAEGAAAEVPGLLRWLEWGALATELGLYALGAGERLPAPHPRRVGPQGLTSPGTGPRSPGPQDPGPRSLGPREAAAWLRPPAPGREGEGALPALGLGGPGPAPDLVHLVDAAATSCLRARLRRTRSNVAEPAAAAVQPLAFS